MKTNSVIVSSLAVMMVFSCGFIFGVAVNHVRDVAARRYLFAQLYTPTIRLVRALDKMGNEGRCDEMRATIANINNFIDAIPVRTGALESIYFDAISLSLEARR